MLFLLCSSLSGAQVQESKTAQLMGSVFQITLVDQDSITAHLNITRVISEIERIENLISEWRPHTQISEVNQNAGIRAVKVDREVFELTERALLFSKISHGAFDISIAAMDKLWVFDGSMSQFPSKKALRNSVKKVNYKDIILDPLHSTIFLKEKGMKIGFGSIGKGYAADKGRALMQALGIQGGLVNASGDIASWGTQINGKPWRIGVNNPFETGELIATLEFSQNDGVATSGSYEKYAEINGKRFTHIINPKTGLPTTGLSSVTIIGERAELCNGFSTAIMVLGVKKGIKLLKRHPEYAYILLTDTGEVVKNL
jgi:thiamine biosynthesis lipoprotein